MLFLRFYINTRTAMYRPFQALPNELLLHTVGFMDARTLLDFLATSHHHKQLTEKKYWKLLYASRWCVDPLELDCYEKDWKLEYKARYLREKAFIQDIEEKRAEYTAEALSEADLEIPGLQHLDISTDVFDQLVVKFTPLDDPWYRLLNQNDHVSLERALVVLQNLNSGGSLSDIQREVDAHRLEILMFAIRKNNLFYSSMANSIIKIIYLYLFNDLTKQSEVPIGLFSFMQDMICKFVINKSKSANQAELIAFNNVAALLITNKMKFPDEYWHKMKFVDQFTEMLKATRDHPTKMKIMKILAVYTRSSKVLDCFRFDEKFVQVVLETLHEVMREQQVTHFTLCAAIVTRLIKQYPDLCLSLGLVDQLIDFAATTIPEFFEKQVETVSAYILCKPPVLPCQYLGTKRKLIDVLAQHSMISENSAEFCLPTLSTLVSCSEEAFWHVYNNQLDYILCTFTAKKFHGARAAFFGLLSVISEEAEFAYKHVAKDLRSKLMPYYNFFITQSFDIFQVPLFWHHFVYLDKTSAEQVVQIAQKFIDFLGDKSKFLQVERHWKHVIMHTLSNLITVYNEIIFDLDLTPTWDVLVEHFLDKDTQKSDPNPYLDQSYPPGLNLLSQYSHSAHYSKLVTENSALMERLFKLAQDDTESSDTHLLLAHLFCAVVKHQPDWDNRQGALEFIEKFVTGTHTNIGFHYPKITPFAYLLRDTNPTEVVMFGTWLLLRVASTVDGRKNISEVIDDRTFTWLNNHSHPKIHELMMKINDLQEHVWSNKFKFY